MPANRFEKQVREQMDDLQLNPSAEVWQRVEQQIRKKKKRRLVIFFLLPIGLGILSFLGVNLISGGDKPKVSDLHALDQPSLHQGSAPSSSQPGDDPSTNTTDYSPLIEGPQHSGPEKSSSPRIATLPVESARDLQFGEGRRDMYPRSGVLANEKKTKNKMPEDSPSGNSSASNKEQPASNETAVNEGALSKKQEGSEKTGGREKVIAFDSLQEKPQQKPVNTKDTANDKLFASESPVLEKPVQPVKRYLRFGIDLLAGVSSSKTNLFSFPGFSRSQDEFTQMPSTGSGSGSVAQRPSTISPGIAFGIGLAVEKRINSRLSINTGLGYSYLSTRIKIGAAKDTSVVVPVTNMDILPADRIYYATGQRDYTNAFHFIQVPLQLQWKLNARLPLYWNLGGSISYLVHTNALIYHPGLGGFYFQDRASFNKWHAGMSTGLAVSLKIGKGRELFLGPSIGLDMTSMLDRKYDRKSYLHYGGLKARLLFSKK